jgi:hypothetical protein
MKKRPHIDRDELANYFTATEHKRVPSPYDIKYTRKTYRVTQETHEKLKAIAKDRGIPLNDLVRWVLRQFLKAYASGEVKLPIEEYVVTVSRLATE